MDPSLPASGFSARLGQTNWLLKRGAFPITIHRARRLLDVSTPRLFDVARSSASTNTSAQHRQLPCMSDRVPVPAIRKRHGPMGQAPRTVILPSEADLRYFPGQIDLRFIATAVAGMVNSDLYGGRPAGCVFYLHRCQLG